MEFLAPLHPAIVHAPVALIIVALVFDLAGRALDSDWWRKASFALLVLGTLGAGVAVLSGQEAGERAEKRQAVPEEAVDAHEDIAKLSLWLALGAVVTRAAAGRLGSARPAVAGLGFLLHLAAAVAVGVAAYRGGELVYRHGAGVTIEGRLLHHPPAGGAHRDEERESAEGRGR